MRSLGEAFFFVFALMATALAQNRLVPQPEPSPAAAAPSYDVSFGYMFHTMVIPGAAEDRLSGFDVGGHVNLSLRWAATLDSSYVRSSDVLGRGHDGHVLSFLVGPEFYPVEDRRIRLFVHTLAGPGLVDATVPAAHDTGFSHGWSTRLSYAVGAGLERSLSGQFRLRFNLDYVGKPFVGSSDVVINASLVFRPKPRFR